MLLANNIEITDEDINYAESILLKDGEKFDGERKDFIKNLDSIDLQAVPGSGKTTALLAKLAILEKKMPFSSGSGILILSHTNTAVDEIKNRLGNVAPKLFQFPNFIGTIQSFVDEFLAKPYGLSFLGTNFSHIDTDYYENLCYEPREARGWLANRDKDTILKKSRKVGDTLQYIDGGFPLTDRSSRTYLALLEMKNGILAKGVIAFDEAYYYGGLLIQKFPKIRKILQKRFRYVFVDEMQDMEKRQVELLESLFYKKNVIGHCFQRVGDRNQAIYSGGEKMNIESEWSGGHRKTLRLTGTHRLTRSTASVVKYFGLEFIQFNGKRILKTGNGLPMEDIRPIMLVHKTSHLNSETAGENRIIQEFAKIIEEKKAEGYFQDLGGEIVCKAVIWSAKPQEDRNGEPKFEQDKCRAKHYFFDYDVESSKTKYKSWLKTEKDYLYYYDKNEKNYKSKNRNIVSLLIRILRVNDIKNGSSYFTRNSFQEFLKRDSAKYEEFKTKIYDWTRRLKDENINEISQEIDAYFFDSLIPSCFQRSLPRCVFDSTVSTTLEVTEEKKQTNIYADEENGQRIQIRTVHSVKGETHTCTLYLESSNKGYESTDKIRCKSFLGSTFCGTPMLGKQAMKMLYVGLSRPTHLLCYAIHEDRYNELISEEGDKERLEELWQIKLLA